MEKILELQRRLAEVQASSNISKISDRVVIDIVDKLIKQQQVQLFYSRDGQEYITYDELVKQIYDQVVMKGKLNILELPDLLNIAYEKIETQLQNLCKKYQDIYKQNDYLFTNDYLDSICEEINEQLQQKQQIECSELASQFKIPKDFLLMQIQKRLGLIIEDAIIMKEKLTTYTYMQRMKSKLRGILRACIKPISFQQISKTFNIENESIQQIIEDLIKDDDIEGKIQSGQFIPTKFLKSQELIVKKFFKDNDYIEYTMLEKQLMVQKPQEFLQKLFKDNCIFLDTCCYNKESLYNQQAQIEQLLSVEGYTALDQILPSVLSYDEIESLIIKNMQLKNFEINEYFIFSKDYLNKCTMSLKQKIIEYIYYQPQALVEKKESSQEQAGKGGGKKKGQAAKKGKGGASTEKFMFSQEDVISTLVQLKVVNPDDREEVFEEKLFTLLKPRILKLYEDIKVELFENKNQTTTEIIGQLQKNIENELIALQFCTKSIKFIEEKFSAVDTNIFEQLGITRAYSILENLIVLICKKQLVQLNPNYFIQPENQQQQQQQQQAEYQQLQKIFKSSEIREEAIEKLPKNFQKIFKDINEYLKNKKQVSEFYNFIAQSAEILGLKLNLNKKDEKNFFYLHKYIAKEQIQNNQQDAKLCFYNQLLMLLLDKQIFLICQLEDKVLNILILLCTELYSEEQEITTQLHAAIDSLAIIKNHNENDENYFKNCQKLEEIVLFLQKIIKF